MVVKLKINPIRIIKYFFIPFSCQRKDFEKLHWEMDGKTHYIDKDQLPDILGYIDILFYSFMYNFVLIMFGNTHLHYVYEHIFIYVTVFYGTVFISRIIAKKKKWLKYKNL